MLRRLKSKLKKKWFNFRVRKIFDSPRVVTDSNSKLVVLSQLHHPDLAMYLIAAKSFARFLKPRKFVIIDDGLLNRDKAVLARHFDNIEFRKSEDVDAGPCPRGGCWERLLGIVDINASDYVIQLDADTITTSMPSEVAECVEQNRCFTLGTPGGEEIIDLEEASRIASKWTSKHVQVEAEKVMAKVPAQLGNRYVHGCAGFAGFAPASLEREKVYAFSNAMSSLLGPDKWAEWGSEQVTSNFMVANNDAAVILPIDTHPFWKIGVDISKAKLIHFFGTHRFKGGQYVLSAKEVLQEISRAGQEEPKVGNNGAVEKST